MANNMIQISKSFDKVTLKNIGVSLLKTAMAAFVTAFLGFLASNIDAIAATATDPRMAVAVTFVIRSIITIGEQWYVGIPKKENT